MEAMGNQGNPIWTKFQSIHPMHKLSIPKVHKLIMSANVVGTVAVVAIVVTVMVVVLAIDFVDIVIYVKSIHIMCWIL